MISEIKANLYRCTLAACVFIFVKMHNRIVWLNSALLISRQMTFKIHAGTNNIFRKIHTMRERLWHLTLSRVSDFVRHHYGNSPTEPGPCRREITLRGFDPPMRVVNGMFVFRNRVKWVSAPETRVRENDRFSLVAPLCYLLARKLGTILLSLFDVNN